MASGVYVTSKKSKKKAFWLCVRRLVRSALLLCGSVGTGISVYGHIQSVYDRLVV